MSNWMTSDFFEKPYNWHEQQSSYETLKVSMMLRGSPVMLSARRGLPKSPNQVSNDQRNHPMHQKSQTRQIPRKICLPFKFPEPASRTKQPKLQRLDKDKTATFNSPVPAKENTCNVNP
jgi:hypothetical protein